MLARALLGILALAAMTSRARANTLASLEDEQSALFDRVAPSVVVIRSGQALGTGFAVAPGLVITAGHNVLGSRDVAVTLRDGRECRGEVVETSKDGLDVALVRIPALPVDVLELSPRPEVRAGSVIAVVGHGDRSLWSLATGLVSNVAPAGPDAALLGLQIPLRPGASGAPVVDRAGRVVGMVAWGAPGAIAFAVRSDGVLRSLSGLADVEARMLAAAEESEAGIGPPLQAPELLVGPADPRPAPGPRVRARTPERGARPPVGGGE
jgi:S1-C subfamily serine protease